MRAIGRSRLCSPKRFFESIIFGDTVFDIFFPLCICLFSLKMALPPSFQQGQKGMYQKKTLQENPPAHTYIYIYSIYQEVLKEDILSAGHLRMGFFALKFAFENVGFRSAIRPRHVNSHCSFQGNSTGKAPSRQGRCHLEAKKAASRRHRALKNAILRCPGFRCMGLSKEGYWGRSKRGRGK